MVKRIGLSTQNQRNWLVDAVLFLAAVLTVLSGIYFLFLPSGGYKGGRNLMYGVTIVFSRQTWDALHTWGGVLMISVVVVHFALHWQWVKMMSKRIMNALLGRGRGLTKGARFNVAIDALIAVSFLLTAVSGIYFLFAPSGGFQGGRNIDWDPMFLFSRTTWDLIHAWAGVALIGAAVVHFGIHWRWVKNVTRRMLASLWARPKLAMVPVVK